VLDLPRAEHGFARLVALFEEGGDVRDVGAEDVGGDVGDLGEAFEAGEEGAPVEPNVSRYSWLRQLGREDQPEHVASVLAVRDGVVAHVELRLHNVLYSFIFGRSKLRLVDCAAVDSLSSLEELVRSEERAKVLCPEGRALVVLLGWFGHCGSTFVFWMEHLEGGVANLGRMGYKIRSRSGSSLELHSPNAVVLSCIYNSTDSEVHGIKSVRSKLQSTPLSASPQLVQRHLKLGAPESMSLT
jgi:hypothetical protein